MNIFQSVATDFFTSYEDLETRTIAVLSEITAGPYFDIVHRTRAILKARTPTEINAAYYAATGFLDKSDALVSDIIEDLWYQDPNSLSRYSIPRMLYLCMDAHNLKDVTGFPDATWAEIFAVVSLNYYSAGIEWMEHDKEVSTTAKTESYRPPLVCMRLMDALEAIMLAESLEDEPESTGRIRQEVLSKLRAEALPAKRKAAAQKHAPTDKLVRDLVTFFEHGGYTKYSTAVTAFLASIPEEKYKHLAPSNRHRTLTQRLSAVIRSKHKKH